MKSLRLVLSRKLIVIMAKQVIATVKTDKQIIVEGVNREKSIFGSASEVCERALLAYFEPERKHEFSVNDIEENRNSNISIHVNVNDCSSLHSIALENGLLMPDLCSIILVRFLRGEIRFYDAPENTVIEPITPVIETESEVITPVIEYVNQEITPIIEPVNDNSENVIIKISELLIPEVQAMLRKNGFEELRYYTTKKEQQTNQQFAKLIQEIRNEHKDETTILVEQIEDLKNADCDIEGLIKSTMIVIEALAGSGRNPFANYKKSDILAIFPEKLRPIFEK